MSLAFVFPGQGSQSVAMLAELADQHEIIVQTFTQASEVLGYDLWALVQDGPIEELSKTEKTQPALLAASVALYRLWLQQGGQAPALMSGHSLGEYSALVCAGAIKFEDAIELVEKRGQFMQSAVPAGTGAMAAILGLTDEQVETACGDLEESAVVQAVNFNSPGQVVIAGHKDAVEAAMARAKEAGAKRALPLPVSAPSHCVLMKPAAEQLKVELEKIEIKVPDIAVIQNVDATAATDVAQIRQNLVEQLFKPVLWVDCVNAMVARGTEKTVECGPGKVLSGLTKRTVKSLTCNYLADAAGLEKALA